MAEEKNGNGKQEEDDQEFKNFQQLLRQVVSVPKGKVDKKLAEEKRIGRVHPASYWFGELLR